MDNLTANQRDAVDEIMDQFDFSAVHMAMTLLNWTWAYESEDGASPAVPSEHSLRRSARKRLVALFERGLHRTASGGLVATKEDGYLSLEFVLSDWSVEYE